MWKKPCFEFLSASQWRQFTTSDGPLLGATLCSEDSDFCNGNSNNIFFVFENAEKASTEKRELGLSKWRVIKACASLAPSML